MMLRFIVVAALVAVCLAERKSYDGYTVLRVTPNTGSELNALKAIKDSELGEKLDFWVEPSYVGRHVDIMVSPLLKADVTRTLSRRGIKVNNWIEDVQHGIELEQMEIPSTNAWGLTKYNTYAEIQQWITDMAATWQHATKESLGTSFEGRDIGYLRLSKGGADKNAFVFTGGMHAREWISPATVIYMTDLLLKDPDTSYLDNLDIYIIPVLNPDGYTYTWTNDRMWRKNRDTNGGGCIGVDLNRNWPKGFGGSGSSGSKCSETYRGPTALSEPESKALDDLLKTQLGNRLKGYIDFHAYSQMWLTTWGYTYSYPPNYDITLPIAEDCAKAIQAVYNKPYEYGTTSRIVYIASGVVQDYTFAPEYLNVLYSFGVELRDTGTYGFLLPSNQIQPSGIETYEALKVVMDAVIRELPIFTTDVSTTVE